MLFCELFEHLHLNPFHTLKEILHAGDELCTLWCQDAEKADTPEQKPAPHAFIPARKLVDRKGAGMPGAPPSIAKLVAA